MLLRAERAEHTDFPGQCNRGEALKPAEDRRAGDTDFADSHQFPTSMADTRNTYIQSMTSFHARSTMDGKRRFSGRGGAIVPPYGPSPPTVLP